MAHTLDLSSARLQAGAVRGGVLREAFGKLDFSRIAGESGVIAVHAAALMLLLVPMSLPTAPAEVEEQVIYEPIKRDPPPPPVPIEVPVQRMVQQPTQAIQQPQRVDPVPIVVTDPSPIDTQPANEVVADVIPVRTNTISEPLTGAHLEYESAPPPRYTAEMMRGDMEGTVLLRVLVGIDGKPLDVTIERSSGHRELDQAARRQVLGKWRFKPAMQDGQTVQAIGLVPVDFKLDR